MATNNFKGKYHTGTFANGQGPVMGQEIKNEAEEKGVLGTGEGGGKHLKMESGHGDTLSGSPSEKNFDLHSKNYAGPENWQPENKGVVNPSDVNKS